MNVHQIDFSPSSQARKYIQKEFSSYKWNRANDLNNISQEFYETCALKNQIIYFVPWFITTYLPLYINVLERSYKDGSGNIIKYVSPLLSFKNFVEEDVEAVSINEINNLISQNNYLGLYVKVLGEHISSLDKKNLDELTALVIQIKNDVKTFDTTSTSKSNFEAHIVSTHVHRPPEIQDFKSKSLNDLEELLDKKLSGLSAKPIDLSDNFTDEMKKTFDFKNHVSLKFNELRGYPKMNSNTKYAHKTGMHTYYYTRPTPQDVLIEERDCNQTNTSYSGSEIYE
ncbi:hypothetical protein H5410_036648 [Solanum commersonii]|uniref:DUF7588 domain-containing protein n=1 Tax=Solanum commersonii TaxID=4109 RepID=A0A9J5Y760_SOLCO|nr:hypothetical protein H5410_036648 [Solanum commersonii]